MNTPRSLRHDAKSPGNGAFAKQSSWFDVVLSRWHANGRPVAETSPRQGCANVRSKTEVAARNWEVRFASSSLLKKTPSPRRGLDDSLYHLDRRR